MLVRLSVTVSFTSCRRSLHAESTSLIKLAKVSHGPLPRPSFGTIGLHQRPVGATFAVLVSKARANKHAPILTGQGGDSTPKVFTTLRLNSLDDQQASSGSTQLAPMGSQIATLPENWPSAGQKNPEFTRSWPKCGSWAKPRRHSTGTGDVLSRHSRHSGRCSA